MKETVEGFKVKEEEYQGYKFKSLYIIIGGKEFLLGTLKEKEKANYINCVHKEFKK